MPKISVIMPVYNSEKYLREAMDSILNQTFPDFEFIILDDGSTDSSPAIVAGYDDPRIRFYQNERNMGVAATLNRGLDLATGEYIARMDGDDISLPRRFEIQAAYMDAHPKVVVLATDVQVFGASTQSWPTSKTHEKLKVDLLFNCCLAHPTVMLRNKVIQSNNIRYDLNYDKMEDYELWFRMIDCWSFACLDAILYQYRIHSAQVTRNYGEEYIKKYCELKMRILRKLDITESNDVNVFVNFCMGISAKNQIEKEELWRILFQICRKNNEIKYFDRKYLVHCICGVAIGMCEGKKERRNLLKKYCNYYLCYLGFPGGVLRFIREWFR